MLKNEFMARLTIIEESQTSFAAKIGVTRECVNGWLNVKGLPEYALLALEALEARYAKKAPDNDSYRVSWVIDVQAGQTPEEAAQEALGIQKDADTAAKCYTVVDYQGTSHDIEL